MNVMNAQGTNLMNKVEAVCQRIAPLWPAKHFVAVNPYVGLSDQSFWQAHKTLERMTGVGLCMPRAYYIEQMANGRITSADLAAALQELGSSWDVLDFEQVLAHETPLSVSPLSSYGRAQRIGRARLVKFCRRSNQSILCRLF